MAVDYKRFLAENVLSERKTVTYRLLSRALKVHNNLAKQMLFEFHRTENAKKPGSVNATYLIRGLPRLPEKPAINGTKRDGDDHVMQSSPYMSSMPQPDESQHRIRLSSFLLAREEDLTEAKSTFESIASIHLYSLQPNSLQDLNVLLDVGREIGSSFGNEDALDVGIQWGMIQNENVKRRKCVRPPQASAATVAPSKPAGLAKQVQKTETTQPKVESDNESISKPSSQKSQTKSTAKASGQRQKGDIFSSFAKSKPKLKTEDSTASAASGNESAEPSAPGGVLFDEDEPSEEEREDLFLDTGERKSNKTRESRKEREEKLKRIMEDDDDEDMPDASETVPESAEAESQPTEATKEPEQNEVVSVPSSRRRGKRKVMKKKTVKDEEGYLVTVEEPVWESFSEDEQAPPPKRKPAVSAAGASKGKKAGQGNIMSFFSKK